MAHPRSPARTTRRHPVAAPRRRGAGLFDGLIALAILAFGLLAMTRFQGRLLAQTTEAQSRQVATQLTAELLSTVLVDNANAACYTLPQQGACANAAAKTRTTAWATRVGSALPGTVTTSANLNGDRMTVRLTWTGKDSGLERSMETVTDVR